MPTINDVINALYPYVSQGMSLEEAAYIVSGNDSNLADLINSYWSTLVNWFQDFQGLGGAGGGSGTGGGTDTGGNTGGGGGGGGGGLDTDIPVTPEPRTGPTGGDVSNVPVPGWVRILIAGAIGAPITYIWIRPGTAIPPGGTEVPEDPIFRTEGTARPDSHPPGGPPVVVPPYTPPPPRVPPPIDLPPPPPVTPPGPGMPNFPGIPPRVPPPAPPVPRQFPTIPNLPTGGGGGVALPGGFPGPVGGSPTQSLFPIQLPGMTQIPLLAALLMRGGQ